MTALLLLSACSGGGGDSSFENANTTIPITNCETYVDVLSGDAIVQDSNGTSIKTVFNTDGSKKVCIISGTAHIVR